jgi:hypothetical protein
MINFFGQLLGADIMPGREPYPPSTLIRLYDDEAGEPLALVGGEELHAELAGLPKFSDITVALRWRQVDLRSLGGTGTGKAYKLRVVKVLKAAGTEANRGR